MWRRRRWASDTSRARAQASLASSNHDLHTPQPHQPTAQTHIHTLQWSHRSRNPLEARAEARSLAGREDWERARRRSSRLVRPRQASRSVPTPTTSCASSSDSLSALNERRRCPVGRWRRVARPGCLPPPPAPPDPSPSSHTAPIPSPPIPPPQFESPILELLDDAGLERGWARARPLTTRLPPSLPCPVSLDERSSRSAASTVTSSSARPTTSGSEQRPPSTPRPSSSTSRQRSSNSPVSRRRLTSRLTPAGPLSVHRSRSPLTYRASETLCRGEGRVLQLLSTALTRCVMCVSRQRVKGPARQAHHPPPPAARHPRRRGARLARPRHHRRRRRPPPHPQGPPRPRPLALFTGCLS